ncbi:hypothetical protein [Haloarchaeobius sp. TZWWS8]|uniref:hypothetical protein n=1 Tax=Haloarchaeobius sp. TZWWS8 TaxID=3446121 RepID=UPI003EB8E274
MHDISRRTLLAGGATALSLGLAGCMSFPTNTRSAGGGYSVDGGTLLVETPNGDVTARLAADLSGSVRASTGNGAVSHRDLELVATRTEKRLLEGTLNDGGGSLLTIETGNGNVSLEPAP